MPTFPITYSKISWPDEPDGSGDDYIEDAGFLEEAPTLRDAYHDLRGGHCEPSEWPVRPDSAPRWLTFYLGTDYRTGEDETRCLHLDNATNASARRICRLFGVR